LSTTLDKLGLAVGKDIDIVAKRSSEFGGFMSTGMIGIDEDFREAGRDLAKFVVAWINGADPATLQRVVGPKV
jgi:LacI family transcriptional regulator